jgi:hypothetical protein
LHMPARASAVTPESRHTCLMPLGNLAGTFRASNQTLMVATDSDRKRYQRHFLNLLRCLSESHRQATRALSHLQESAQGHLECFRHEASGESANTINRMYTLGTGKSSSQLARAITPLVENQLMRAVTKRLNRQQRFCSPLRKAASSPEFPPKTSGRAPKNSALRAHSKGGETC